MQNQKADGGSCGTCFSMSIFVGFIGYMLYTFGRSIIDILKFFQQPDALARIIEFIQTIGMCCGAAILFIIIMLIIPESVRNFLFGGSGSSDDDNYYN